MNKTLKINSFYYYFTALLLSLNLPLLSGISFYLSDLTVLILIFSSLIFIQRIYNGSISYGITFLALSLLLSNLFNFYDLEGFIFISFFLIFLKIITILFIIYFIPSLIYRTNLDKVFSALLFILKLHCILVFFDHYIAYPWSTNAEGIVFGFFEENLSLSERGRGIFEEPSFFAIYAGLAGSTIIQYEHFLKKNFLKTLDILIISFGLISSSSLTGLFILIILALQLLIVRKKEILRFSFLFKIFIISTFMLPIAFLISSTSLSYLSDRLTLSDGSSIGRLYGSALISYEIIQERPVNGFGLGEANMIALKNSLDSDYTIELENLPGEEQTIYPGSVTFWSSLLIGGGVPSLLIFYLIIIYPLLIMPHTRFLGMMIFLSSFFGGGIFDLSLWLFVAICISLSFHVEPNKLAENG